MPCLPCMPQLQVPFTAAAQVQGLRYASTHALQPAALTPQVGQKYNMMIASTLNIDGSATASKYDPVSHG